ncbi:methyl-accepting chemotaxis protein [Epibacterium sp. Ofav1-8]|uniref:methyl-accepting chemotaxis protein n=1 Tax=Epibacterium sp. Ofav1-8 TaxID=2917735 RepID=UPI002104969B|nr:PAS domain-containing methyl-accepting chemotaxis protein [Epibacterium sp. Ofav1-8]
MLFGKSKKTPVSALDSNRLLSEMIDRTQALIEFEPDGTIIRANENFLTTMGYELEEIQGKHHSMFVYPSFAKTERYTQMWADLAAGKAYADQFPRLRKNGDVVWIQATYGPILDADGKVIQVVKIATDVTGRRQELLGIGTALEELRKGDLTYRLPPSDREDIQRLVSSYNGAVEALQDAISAVNEVAQGVNRTADEMNTSSAELSHRTENQAATLEQTAAAIEELTATVRSAADGAKEVESNVQTARDTAKKSGHVVEEAVNAMSKIEASSEEIAKIISVIDDIAFQTNLLALNAGVEAARAGEAGRGFAVVASEVRGLALRSADAAGEIKGLIEQSTKHVADGVSLVGRTGTELENIIASVNSISENVTEIARGTEEQSVTLGEINTGISQLDEVTQHNAAMVEETTAASQTLANDAKEMTRQMARFETGNGATQVVDMHASAGGTADRAEPAPQARTGTD